MGGVWGSLLLCLLAPGLAASPSAILGEQAGCSLASVRLPGRSRSAAFRVRGVVAVGGVGDVPVCPGEPLLSLLCAQCSGEPPGCSRRLSPAVLSCPDADEIRGSD